MLERTFQGQNHTRPRINKNHVPVNLVKKKKKSYLISCENKPAEKSMGFLDVVKSYEAFAAQRNSLLSETSHISDYKNKQQINNNIFKHCG